MNTIFVDRLQGDPRFKALVREIGDPLKAAGALYFVWSGTQNLHLTEATETQLMDCFPLGYRGVKPALRALTQTGWLVKQEDGYRITGNESHVISAKTISEKNRAAALARWDAERMRNAVRQASDPHSARDANAMRADALPSRTVLNRTVLNEEVPGAGELARMLNGGSNLLADAAPVDPAAVPKAWAAYCEAKEARGSPSPVIISDVDKGHLRQLIAWTSPAEVIWVLRAWVLMDSPTKSLSNGGWPLTWLVKPDNFERARNGAALLQQVEAKKAERAAMFSAIDAGE